MPSPLVRALRRERTLGSMNVRSCPLWTLAKLILILSPSLFVHIFLILLYFTLAVTFQGRIISLALSDFHSDLF
jgi:hypothetical protein